MRSHHAHGFGKNDLIAMASTKCAQPIDDMEFLETLAQRRCMLMPPWIFHIGPRGKLEKLTPVRYTTDYNLDKPAILLAVMNKLAQVVH